MAVKITHDAVPFKERQETADNIKNGLPDNCLAVANPNLAAEWHPTKNGSLTPDMVTKGSNKKAWWKCRLGHEWQTRIVSRSRGTGCPFCRAAEKRHP